MPLEALPNEHVAPFQGTSMPIGRLTKIRAATTLKPS